MTTKRPTRTKQRDAVQRSRNVESAGEKMAAEAKPFAETSSETRPHNGRPKRFSDKLIGMVSHLWPEPKTLRGRQNKAYMHRAIGMLGYRKKFAWLGLESLALARSPDGFMRITVLSELGRVESKELMQAMASEICRLAPPTQRGAALIVRGWRCDGFGSGHHADVLASRISTAIRDCKMGLPSIQPSVIREAMNAVDATLGRDWNADERYAAELAADIAERSAAIRVLVDIARPSPGRLAASAAVLIVPELSAAARLRMADGRSTESAGFTFDEAGKLFGVNARYVGDAARVRSRDPAVFAQLLAGTIDIRQALAALKRGRR